MKNRQLVIYPSQKTMATPVNKCEEKINRKWSSALKDVRPFLGWMTLRSPAPRKCFHVSLRRDPAEVKHKKRLTKADSQTILLREILNVFRFVGIDPSKQYAKATLRRRSKVLERSRVIKRNHGLARGAPLSKFQFLTIVIRENHFTFEYRFDLDQSIDPIATFQKIHFPRFSITDHNIRIIRPSNPNKI